MNKYSLITYFDFNQNLEKDWKDLTNHNSYSPFQSYEWLNNWYISIGSKTTNLKLFIIVFKLNNHTTDIFPLCIYKKKFHTTLEFIGGINTDIKCSLHSSENSILKSKKYNYEIIWKKIIP